MKCYILELKEVYGNRVENTEGLAKSYHTNATHNTLAYAGPSEGEYIRAYAFQAENMEEARKMAMNDIYVP